MIELLGLPQNASAHGGEIDHVIGMVHILMVLLFGGWGIFFVYTLFRFRKSRNPTADYTGVKSHTSTYLEITVAVFEAILLVGFAIPMWSHRVNAFPPEKDAIVVRVVAQQFAWNIHYPGPDGVFGKTDPSLVNETTNPLGLDRNDPAAKDDYTTINQLHLPVDKAAIIRLSTKDVIHSFGIPLMRVKQDAIPGMTIPLWFEPKKTGEFEIACSQLCGLGHYRMKGFVTIQSGQDFEAWQKEQEAAAAQQVQSGGGDNFWQ